MSDKVKNMFGEIADKYDFMNDLLSFGIHRKWRKTAVKLSSAKPGMSVLDCACGTGDLSFAFKEAVGASGKVEGTDFCEPMIAIAKAKASDKNIDVKFQVEDAMKLSYGDNIFDLASISFGIRNVDDTVVCLKELARVVKPNGKVVVVEFGQPKGFFKLLYALYSYTLMPIFGLLFAKHRAAYEYLPETAAKYPCREEFLALMEKSGAYSSYSYKTLTFGIAFIYIGIVK